MDLWRPLASFADLCGSFGDYLWAFGASLVVNKPQPLPRPSPESPIITRTLWNLCWDELKVGARGGPSPQGEGKAKKEKWEGLLSDENRWYQRFSREGNPSAIFRHAP